MIDRFIERIKVENIPNDVRERYESAIRYYNGSILGIEEKVEENGIEVGKEIGKDMEKRERDTTKRMLLNKMLIEMIQGFPGLSQQDIEQISM